MKIETLNANVQNLTNRETAVCRPFKNHAGNPGFA